MKSRVCIALIQIIALTTLSNPIDGKSKESEFQTMKTWGKIRSDREEKILNHLSQFPGNGDSLIVGSNGGSQIPMVYFRLFNELFPEIWGTSDQHYAQVGLSKNQFRPNTNLPLGMALSSWENSVLPGTDLDSFVKVNRVGFNCLACHAGQVIDSNGKTQVLLGAPNTRIDSPLFLFAKTSQHRNFTSTKFIEALRSKPLGWVYDNPAMLEIEKREREILLQPEIAEKLVKEIRNSSGLLLTGFKVFRLFSYSKFNSPNSLEIKRGFMDGLVPSYLAYLSTLGSLRDITAVFKTLPKSAAEVDVTSIWNQRGRGPNHWDGAMQDTFHRNVGAAAGSLNSPVNVSQVKEVYDLLLDLPSSPYPFEVNLNKASRGEKLFIRNCQSCHQNTNQIYDYKSVGTDPNRFLHFTKNASVFQGHLLLKVCQVKWLCSKSDGSEFLPEELSIKTAGYVGGRLDGIWARAPYLHNGSVPTLRALLTNQRPTKFYRGAITYDTKNVGFTWNQPIAGSVLYNTQLDGNSNRGHDSTEYLGLNWSRHPVELEELLEYLKTL